MLFTAIAVRRAWVLPTAALIVGSCLGGCSLGNAESDSDGSSASQQAATASQSIGVLTEASVEALLSDATNGSSAKALTAVQEPVPDLKALTGTSSRTIDLRTFRINGQTLFPGTTVSGTLTIATDGTAVGSWPTGNAQLFTGDITVTVANVVIENGNGDNLSIPSGSFTHTLSINSTKTDDLNWTLTWNATAVVNPALTASLTKGSTQHSLSLSGKRAVQATITRSYGTNGSGVVTTNRRTVDRSVSGDVAGTSLTSNATNAARQYSNWTVSVDGQPVTWNRSAGLSSAWDYTLVGSGSAFSVTAAYDVVFITTGIGAARIIAGPYTTAQAASFIQSKLDPNVL